MKHVPNAEEVKMADSLDLSRVDKNDRGEVRNVILNILQYEFPMPRVTIDVFSGNGHYNIAIKGWAQPLDVSKLYNTFLGPDKPTEYESVLGLELIPINDEGVPVLKWKLRQSGFSKIKRRH